MGTLLITLIQTDIQWEKVKTNLAILEKKILDIGQKTDVIVLPEMFTTGFSMNSNTLATTRESYEFVWMARMAKQANALILGSLIVIENEKYYNQLIWMEPTGNFKTYNKRHLFRMENEHEHYASGNNRLIAHWRGWNICPLICYDLRFPLWSRNQWNREKQQLNYDLLIYVANWPERRIIAWDTLLQARAVENLAFVAGVNRVGKDGNEVVYGGHSKVIDPKGKILFDAQKEEANKTIVLQFELMSSHRKKFPAYLDADNFRIT